MPELKIQAVPEVVPADYEANYFGIEWLDTDALIVDHKYQRPEQVALIRTISSNWDWRAVRTLAVSLRVGDDGNNYYAVIDGQQRLSGARELNIEKLPCQIYIDLTEPQEAELFLKLNNSKKVTSNDLFRASLAKGDEQSKLIAMAVRNTGWELDLSNGSRANKQNFAARTINSSPTLVKIYRSGGIMHLTSVLNICHGWYGQHMAASSDIMGGLSGFLLKYQGSVDLSRLTEKLGQESPGSILGKAGQIIAAENTLGQGASTRSKSVERVILSLYNKGLRGNAKLGNEEGN